MTVRELLGVTLRDDAKGLPSGVQSSAIPSTSSWSQASHTWAAWYSGPYGGVVGVVVGVLLGSGVAAAIFRGYRARQSTQA